MTDTYQQGEGSFASTGTGGRPPTLWLAVIPMVVVSVVGILGGHARPARERAEQPQGHGSGREMAMEMASRDLPARPPDAMAGRQIRTVATTSTTSTTSTASAATASTTALHAASTIRPVPSTAPSPRVSSAPASGCVAALQWLWSHAAPGFRFQCPGNALGHQGMTCVDVANVCPGERIIAIADPCPAAYMNEAHNSWVLTGLAAGRLDPYGYCG